MLYYSKLPFLNNFQETNKKGYSPGRNILYLLKIN
jgi:hypothetical protein